MHLSGSIAWLGNSKEFLNLLYRKKIYDQAQERILQLVPMVSLFHSAQYEGIATFVKGFEHYANSSYLGLRTTSLEK